MTAYVYRGRKRDAGVDLIAANRAILAARPLTAEPIPDPQCGTYPGYLMHRRRRQAACDECRAAYAAYRKAHR